MIRAAKVLEFPAQLDPQADNSGPVPLERRVILHADDFGMNDAVNRGIIRGFAEGLLTSTSVLANAPGCSAALESWRELTLRQRHEALPSSAARRKLGESRTTFDLGIHLNLTQGRPLTGERYPARLLDPQGLFPGVFRLFAGLLKSNPRERRAIFDELAAQIELLLDHGLAPTHLNGHQYVELLPPVADLVPELLDRYRIPVVRVAWECGLARTTLWSGFRPAAWGLAHAKRLFAMRFLLRMRHRGTPFPGAFFGTAHAGRIDLAVLGSFLSARDSATIEIGLHPGCRPVDESSTGAAVGWHDPLAAARVDELSLLTSAELAELLTANGFRLGRLGDLAAPQQRRMAA